MSGIDICERGLVPDWITRAGMRRLMKQRLKEQHLAYRGDRMAALHERIEAWRSGPVAVHTRAANEQHYELPPAFFEHALGPHLKYSSCYWPRGVDTLAAAEAASLAQVCERAALEDGMNILELGCGWGSLSLWMSEHFPASTVTAVSNSAPQRAFIEARRDERGLTNLRVITADVNAFDTEERFDRVVSVEMFEHVRNHTRLMDRIAQWLTPHGRLFVHVFCHRSFAYAFETEGDDNWMGRYFFTGGIMPSEDLLPVVPKQLCLAQQWRLPGIHYQQTAEAWLANLDRNREPLLECLSGVYGAGERHRWLQRWRMFFMACAELFGYRKGSEWMVAHYAFEHDAVK